MRFSAPSSAVLVLSEDVHDALVVHLRDGDGRARSLLDVLNHLAAGADHGADHVLRNGDLNDARHERLVVGARLGDALGEFAEDVQASLTGLLQRGGQHFVRKAVHLDVHLGGGDAVLGARHLEVHVAQVVLIAQNVRQYGPFAALRSRKSDPWRYPTRVF